MDNKITYTLIIIIAIAIAANAILPIYTVQPSKASAYMVIRTNTLTGKSILMWMHEPPIPSRK